MIGAEALQAAAGESGAEVVFAAASALLKLGDPTGYRVYYAVLTGQRKTGEPLVESQLKMLKDPNALARIGFEQGIGFIPFGGIGLQAVKAFRQDTVSPVRAAAAQRLAGDPDPAFARSLVSRARNYSLDASWSRALSSAVNSGTITLTGGVDRSNTLGTSGLVTQATTDAAGNPVIRTFGDPLTRKSTGTTVEAAATLAEAVVREMSQR